MLCAVPCCESDSDCLQAKGAELDARLRELKVATAHHSQLSEASKQEEALLRQALLPFQV